MGCFIYFCTADLRSLTSILEDFKWANSIIFWLLIEKLIDQLKGPVSRKQRSVIKKSKIIKLCF